MNDVQHRFDDVLELGLPINNQGYIHEELLILPQFLEEYVCTYQHFLKEVDEGRLNIFMRYSRILVARTDAEKWVSISEARTARRSRLDTMFGALEELQDNRMHSSKRNGG